MCGIAGAWAASPEPAEGFRQRLARMSGLLAHRGPDFRDLRLEGSIGFAHARLAVIDLRPEANQPMTDAESAVWLVFNGEIYNFRELRQELQEAGATFHSHSDTEVVLRGYLRWGRAVLERLRGMFAIAIWDAPKRRLMLARDRMGQKPLYYHQGPGGFAFASEIKALFALPWVPRQPHPPAIHDFLTLQYVPAPETAFTGIRRLPSGHVLEVEGGPGGAITVERYWHLPHPDRARGSADPLDLTAELRRRLEEAVRMRMVADVPVGAFLSGGVDSSSIVALMATNSDRPVKTFAIGFREEDHDERAFARLVARRYGTDHHELELDPAAGREVLGHLAWHHGEPFADPSAIATFHVSAMARRHVSVVLTGDGGDESFLGYGRYRDAANWPRRPRLPGILGRLANQAADRLPSAIGMSRAGMKLRALAARWGGDRARWYAPSIHYFMEGEKHDAVGEALRPCLRRSTLAELDGLLAAATDPAVAAAWADLHTYLPDDLLVKLDVSSMAHGLEARSPFLDHPLQEWVASIPGDTKLTGGPKGLLKTAVAPLLPSEILNRPKMGFGVPVADWLRGPWRDLAEEVLLDGRFLGRGLIRRRWLEWALKEQRCGRLNLWQRIWALMVLELWYRSWIDTCSPSPLTV